MRNYLRVGSLCRPVGKAGNRWRNNVVLRVAKRDLAGWRISSSDAYRYFVVGLEDPAGYGCWCTAQELRKLSPLELLAMEAV